MRKAKAEVDFDKTLELVTLFALKQSWKKTSQQRRVLIEKNIPVVDWHKQISVFT